MINNLKVNYLFVLTLCFSIVLTSCSKDEDSEPMDDTPDPVEQPTSNSALQFDGADGFCAAVISTTSYVDPISGFSFDIDFGTAVSGFTNDDWGTFVNAGTVSCEAQLLDLQPNNSYVHTYTYDPLNPSDLGLDFGNTASWNVGGGSGVPAFDHETSIGFPSMGILSGDAILDRSMDYTVSLSQVGGADSIIYQVGNVLTTVAGNITNYTFSADELINVPTGPSIVQATAYISEFEDIGEKVIYFINERSKSLSVTVE